MRVHRSAYVPYRWAPSYHRHSVRHLPTYHPRYWSTGIFIYSPPPPTREVVVVEHSRTGKSRAPASEEPSRAFDRSSSFAVGLKGGSFLSGYDDGGSYGDMGMGLTARFRPVEAVGFEASWMRHSQSWDAVSERSNSPFSVSAQLFAFPWARLSPFATAGLTWNRQTLNDTYFNGLEEVTVTSQETRFGPHVGLGMEFALGERAALDLEARYISDMNHDAEDPTRKGAMQASAGIVFHF